MGNCFIKRQIYGDFIHIISKQHTMVASAVAAAAAATASASPLAAARTGAARGALACVVYVSEGRRMDVLKAIESVALSKRITTKPNEMKTKRDDDDETYNNNAVKLVKTFIDEPYNRTGFTFAVRTDDDFDDAVNGGDNSEFGGVGRESEERAAEEEGLASHREQSPRSRHVGVYGNWLV